MENMVQVMGKTIESTEIAEMLNITHYKLLEKLEGRKDKKIKGIIEILTEHQMVVSEYFRLSSYKDSTAKENKCYLLTKLGCDLIANKLQGEKRILFSAKYVKKFAEIENSIGEKARSIASEEEFKLNINTLKEQNAKIDEIKSYIDEIKNSVPLFSIECKELQGLVRKNGIKVLGGYKSPAYNNNSLRSKVYKDMQHQLKREFGVERYEAIKRCQFEAAKKIIEEYKPPIVLINKISIVNANMPSVS